MSLIGFPIHSALCHILAKSFVNHNHCKGSNSPYHVIDLFLTWRQRCCTLLLETYLVLIIPVICGISSLVLLRQMALTAFTSDTVQKPGKKKESQSFLRNIHKIRKKHMVFQKVNNHIVQLCPCLNIYENILLI